MLRVSMVKKASQVSVVKVRKLECPSSSFESEGHIVSTGPVSRILSRTIIPLGPPSLADSSDLPGSSAHRAGTHASLRLQLLPYLVLLRVGFAMRRALLPGRCALTAPFHPYCTLLCSGIFSVALSVNRA